MNKKVLLACFMAGVMSFGGCSKQTETTNTEIQSQEYEEYTGKTEVQSQEHKEYWELTVIDQGELNCSSDQGYYYVAKDGFLSDEGNYSFNMMYMDYETKKEIVLCNRPGCEHKSENCPSVFSDKEVVSGSSLFFLNGKLYLFSHAGDQDGTVTVQKNSNGGLMQEGTQPLSTKPAAIYEMNSDGTQRKKVFEFESNEAVEDTVMVNGNTLFFFTKQLSTESVDNFTSQVSATKRTLIEVDMDSWESNVIVELDTDWKVIGSAENKIIFSNIDLGQELSKEDYLNDDKYLAAYRNSETKIITLNLKDKKTKEILSLSNGKLNTFVVGKDVLYFSSEGTNQINQINLDTFEQSVFKETSANEIDAIYDEMLICSKWESEDISSIDTRMYFISTKDRSEKSANLKTKTMGTKIEIKAELDDQFLVVYDYDATLDTKYDNGQYTINGLRFGLIDKIDMYSGNENYQAIDMIGFGE